MLDNVCIGVIGLGYVGLPLAVEFSKKYEVVGFDIDRSRVEQLVDGVDRTGEVAEDRLDEMSSVCFSSDPQSLKRCNVYIVTVPTPIDMNRQPDLTPLINASKLVGTVISRGDVVIYESTVYPGATEDDCIPVVEEFSGLTFNVDFYAGYSPERINPGDKLRPLTKIVKVTSGSTEEVSRFVDELYSSILEVGTYRAKSIRIAEASKVIENTQRDVNIALINELAMIFDELDIDVNDVIEAASTKWNFVKLKPGMVGGHCIGVDPYYLVHKSMSVGHVPDIIRTAREINDGMAKYFSSKLIKLMVRDGGLKKGARVLVLGVTFKENCPDVRNTKVVDFVRELETYNLNVEVYDPVASSSEVREIFGIELLCSPKHKAYSAVVCAVPHKCFSELSPKTLLVEGSNVLMNVKERILS
ncbi:UDP-N-acetyl-D-galactosamine dehydrogenase [Marinimicrobium koreense]|uniref:UDP-N-acetyl-D-galactosamine dehydrogenase n=1 Tax=Marinimicrobium koreense TaxID=306545 RepID=A0A3N1NV17_9GAMM|nr:nucleotide sugar dehydrogenase [Marinimicrobium koreense]ROQ20045.1 UDP-N-acetyl-D-galactosamine dehydrogenase [Marinimicrobium koreense]